MPPQILHDEMLRTRLVGQLLVVKGKLNDWRSGGVGCSQAQPDNGAKPDFLVIKNYVSFQLPVFWFGYSSKYNDDATRYSFMGQAVYFLHV